MRLLRNDCARGLEESASLLDGQSWINYYYIRELEERAERALLLQGQSQSQGERMILISESGVAEMGWRLGKAKRGGSFEGSECK